VAKKGTVSRLEAAAKATIPKGAGTSIAAMVRREIRAMLEEVRARREKSPSAWAVITQDEERTARFVLRTFEATTRQMQNTPATPVSDADLSIMALRRMAALDARS
jgi:hypothetical protein